MPLFGMLVLLLFCGCKTSTIATRSKERAASYSALTPEWRTMVDHGQIKVGMPMDAVYIAWGKPDRVIQAENAAGASTTWIYNGTTLKEYRYWSYRYVPYGYRYYPEPYIEHDYRSQSYKRAEVVFVKELVSSWRTVDMPRD